MTMTKFDRVAAREKWQKLVQECEESDQSAARFCAERGIKPYSFLYWRRILKQGCEPSIRSADSSSFREISVSSLSFSYSVQLRSGRTLLVPADFAESALRKLISILEAC